MTEQLLILTMSAFIAFLVPTCCYLLSKIRFVDCDYSTLESLRQWTMMGHNQVVDMIVYERKRIIETIEDRTKASKPRYQVANAIVRLPRRRKSVADSGNEVKNG